MLKEKLVQIKKKISGWLKNLDPSPFFIKLKEKRQAKKKEKLDDRVKLRWNRIPKVVKGGVCILIFLAATVILYFVQEGDKDRAMFIAYMIGGGLLILQIYISNRRVTAAEETAKAMQKTAESAETGNIAERFKNAIEHLGDKSASVRLGGIYALNQLAQNASEYRRPVFDILCAHIRETTSPEEYKVFPPTIETQTILYLLFTDKGNRKAYIGLQAILKDAFLQGADLRNANLENANLAQVNLKMTMLNNAVLTNTNLYSADLQYSNLDKVNFSISTLERADLEYVKKLEPEQLLDVRTLYEAILPDEIKRKVVSQKPELFEDPDDKQEN